MAGVKISREGGDNQTDSDSNAAICLAYPAKLSSALE
jgi:hypothetical protein